MIIIHHTHGWLLVCNHHIPGLLFMASPIKVIWTSRRAVIHKGKYSTSKEYQSLAVEENHTYNI